MLKNVKFHLCKICNKIIVILFDFGETVRRISLSKKMKTIAENNKT